MGKSIAVLLGGIILGVLVSLAASRFGQPDSPAREAVIHDIADVPPMTQEAADKHRLEEYASLTSIEELMRLPTEFARSAALFSLADRSDSATVQKLIFDANRIADEAERISLLNVLFFRLAELDPRSALVLARADDFGGIKSLERTVWRTWARMDLDDALFEAKTQTSVAHENSAAQSLYAAFGYMGNATTDRIESELGIGPDRASRGRYLYGLADESLSEAIAFINALDRGVEQQEYVSWLAYYVSLKDPYAALASAPLFSVASDQKRFASIIKTNIARQDPLGTIDRLLAAGSDSSNSQELYSAVRALASTDLTAVIRYYDEARSEEHRRIFGSMIAAELAKADPDEALAWADANETGQSVELRMAVLSQIAAKDPERAFTEALKIPNSRFRAGVAAQLVRKIARDNPDLAASLLDRIQNKQHRLEATQQLASVWMRKDPEAATTWILSHDEEAAGEMLQTAAFQLLHRDVDKAIQLLPKLDPTAQAGLRQQIAQQLATSRSPTDAQAFIRQFEGQPGYDQLQASVIAGVAQSDVFMAKQLADQLTRGGARDRAYVQVISQQAQTDPVLALGWLNSIDNERMRGAAAGQLVTQWHGNDSRAAERWVSSLPGGALRDDVIVHMSSRWREPTGEQADLIASIEDREKRGQAKIRRAYALMRTDPAGARKLLEDEDIPSNMRQELEIVINQYGIR